MLRMIALCSFLFAGMTSAFAQEEAKPPYRLEPQILSVTACATQAETEQYVRVALGGINWDRNVASADKLTKTDTPTNKPVRGSCTTKWVKAVIGPVVSRMLAKNSLGIYFITEISVVAEPDKRTGQWVPLARPLKRYWSNYFQTIIT